MRTLSLEFEKPDVTAIMREIRRLIGDSGGFGSSALDAEQLYTRRLTALAVAADVPHDSLNEILAGGDRWNVVGDFPLVSHRPGLTGRLVVRFKTALRPLVRMLINPLIYRQAELNRYYREVIHELVRESIRLRRELSSLRLSIRHEDGKSSGERCAGILERLDRLVTFDGRDRPPGPGDRPAEPAAAEHRGESRRPDHEAPEAGGGQE